MSTTICDFRVLARLLLVGAVGVAPHDARRFAAAEIGRQVAAGMDGADPQAGELVEDAVEDQPRQKVGGLQRIADDVAEVAAAAKRAVLDDVLRAAGMHHDEGSEFGCLRPERVVLRQREILAVDVAADRCAAQPQPLHAVLELRRGLFGMLQRHRRHRDEPIGVLRHPLGEALVLRSHDPICQVTIRGGVPPETVDGQRLDVHTLLVHHLQSLRSEETGAGAAAHLGQRRALDDVGDRDDAVGVGVDDLDGPPADGHTAPRLRGQPGQAASRQQRAGRSSRHGFEEAPSGPHATPQNPYLRRRFLSSAIPRYEHGGEAIADGASCHREAHFNVLDDA